MGPPVGIEPMTFSLREHAPPRRCRSARLAGVHSLRVGSTQGVRWGCALGTGQARASDPKPAPLLGGVRGQGLPEAIAQRCCAPLMPGAGVQMIRDRVGGGGGEWGSGP